MRSTSATLRRAITRQQTDQVFLVLLEFDHPDRVPDLLDASLRGAWLNSEVARTADDYSTAADDLTAIGSPAWPDEGATFDGAADYLRRAEAAWRPDAAGTVMAWVSRASFATADAIFGSCDEGTADEIFYVGIRGDDRVEVYSKTGGAVSAHVRGGTTITTDAWRHVAVVSTGTAYAVYVDGAAETLTVIAGADNGDWLADVANRDNVTVGARRHSAVADYFDGTIRDMRYFSRALGSVEVDRLYKAGLTTPIRVVNDNRQAHSGGKLYLPFPFEVQLPDERDDKVASVRLRIDNVDRQIVEAIRRLASAPTVSIFVVLASSPDLVEAGPFLFTLRKVSYDAVSVTAQLEYEDVLREPIPGDSFTPTNFPGMFKGV